MQDFYNEILNDKNKLGDDGGIDEFTNTRRSDRKYS